MTTHALDRAIAAYRERFGGPPTLITRAPGRVNLIGEHTDYNDGFVLPMALPFDIVIAATPRHDGRVLAHSEGFDPIDIAIEDPIEAGGWSRYVHGMASILRDLGEPIAGWQGCIAGDIATGASLSSSAALEVAAGLAFVTAAGHEADMTLLARVGRRVENEVLGLPSGIMDQLVSATATAGTASLIDCRDLTTTAVPVPDDVEIVIMDTGTRRELVTSEYGVRRADCAAAASALGVASLREASLDRLEAIEDDRIRRRARHVIGENARTLDAAAAMRAGDSARFGKLVDESHASLRDDYEVSGPALDRIVDLSRSVDGCLGARMTGGGFAGAALAVVRAGGADSFMASVTGRYRPPSDQPARAPVRLYAVRPAAGASIVTGP